MNVLLKVPFYESLHLGTYCPTLDVLMELTWFVAKLLLAKRRRHRTLGGSRALAYFQ